MKRIALLSLALVLLFAGFILGQLTANPATIHDAKPILQRIKSQYHPDVLPLIERS